MTELSDRLRQSFGAQPGRTTGRVTGRTTTPDTRLPAHASRRIARILEKQTQVSTLPEEEEEKEEKPGTFGRIFNILSTSPFGDIPILPDFLEDALLSPVGLLSIAAAPITGGTSLAGLAATTTGRAAVKSGLSAGARQAALRTAGRTGAKQVAGEAVFGGAAHLATEAVGDVLPEETPSLLRGAITLGAGLGAGVVATRRLRQQPFADMKERMPGLATDDVIRHDKRYQLWQEGKAPLDEGGVVLMERLHAATDDRALLAKTFSILSDHRELEAMGAEGLGVAGKLVRNRILGVFARSYHPAAAWEPAERFAINAAESTSSGAHFLLQEELEQLADAYHAALPRGVSINDFHAGRPLPEGIAEYTGTVDHEWAGTLQHLLENPENYRFETPALEKAFALQDRLANKDGIGFIAKQMVIPEFKAIDNYGASRRWRGELSEVEDELQLFYTSSGRSSKIRAEFPRTFKLEEHGNLSEAVRKRLGDLEDNNMLELFLKDGQDAIRRLHDEVGIDQLAKQRTEGRLSALRLPDIDREIKELQNTVDEQRILLLEVSNRLQQEIGVPGRVMNPTSSRAGKKRDFLRKRLDKLEETRSTLSEFRIPEGQAGYRDLSDLSRVLQEIKVDLAAAQDLTQLPAVQKIDKTFKSLIKKVNQKGIQRKAALDQAEAALRDLPTRDRLLDETRRVEDLMNERQQYEELEKAIRVGVNPKIKTLEDFPDHLVPTGFSVEELRNAYQARKTTLSKLEELAIPADDRTIVAKAAADWRKLTTQLDANEMRGLRHVANLSNSMREVMLTADGSVFTIQGVAATLADPLNAHTNFKNAVQFATSPAGWRAFKYHQAADFARFQRAGADFNEYLASEIGGAFAKSRPGVEKIPGVGGLFKHYNDAAYGRGVTYLKLMVMKHTADMMIASKHQGGFRRALGKLLGTTVPKDLTDEAIDRIAVKHATNVLGGQNLRRLGLTRNQRNLEKVLILTPDYLRSTLGIAGRGVFDWQTPQGALARRLLGGFFSIAAIFAYTVHELFGGEEPNVFNPQDPGWLNMRVPVGDTTVNINPFSRFISVVRPVAKALGVAVSTQDLGLASVTGMESAGQFLKGRQSAPLGSGIEALTGKDFFGNPIRQDEDTFLPAWGNHLVRNLMPIGVQHISEQGFDPATIAEFMGTNTYTVTADQNAVIDALEAEALNRGVPVLAVKAAIIQGQNPLNAKDADGRFFLTSEQRADAVDRASTETALSPDVVRRIGREERTLSPDQVRAADQAVREAFYRDGERVKEIYAEHMVEVATYVTKTQDYVRAREYIGEVRSARRAQQAIRNDPQGPYTHILEQFQDPERIKQQNELDLLRQDFLTAIYSNEFESVQGFDFSAQAAEIDKWRRRFGDALIDQFLAKKDLTPLEEDLEIARLTLGPYWDLADIIWLDITGGRFGRDPDQSTAPPNILRQYTRRLNIAKRRMRLNDAAVDAALVKWYGNQPIR